MFKTLKSEDDSYGINISNINFIESLNRPRGFVIIHFKDKDCLEVHTNNGMNDFMEKINSDQIYIKVIDIRNIS